MQQASRRFIYDARQLCCRQLSCHVLLVAVLVSLGVSAGISALGLMLYCTNVDRVLKVEVL
jgi:hypothetical protein